MTAETLLTSPQLLPSIDPAYWVKFDLTTSPGLSHVKLDGLDKFTDERYKHNYNGNIYVQYRDLMPSCPAFFLWRRAQ